MSLCIDNLVRSITPFDSGFDRFERSGSLDGRYIATKTDNSFKGDWIVRGRGCDGIRFFIGGGDWRTDGLGVRRQGDLSPRGTSGIRLHAGLSCLVLRCWTGMGDGRSPVRRVVGWRDGAVGNGRPSEVDWSWSWSVDPLTRGRIARGGDHCTSIECLGGF
jgi:hypothetical protein